MNSLKLFTRVYVLLNRPIPVVCLQSYLAAWAIMRIGSLHSMNMIGFLFFLLSLVFFLHCRKEAVQDSHPRIKKQRFISFCLGTLFTLFYLSDIYYDIVQDLSNGLFKGIVLTLTALGLYLLFSRAILYLHFLLDRFCLRKYPYPVNRMLFPVIAFILCLLCRIPFLLYSYPGIMTPDSINQFEQVLGMIPYNNHHPWVHTLTISLFYHLGTLFASSVNGAFVFYTVFQICFMAFAVSYLIRILSFYTGNRGLLWGIILFYAFVPYHNVMAICIWKDVMFAGILLLFTVSAFHLQKEGVCGHTRFSVVIYFLSGCMMCLYRSNGWYAFLLILPFLLICFRKQFKTMLPLHLLLLCLVLLVKGPVMEHYGVKQPDFVESISIPLQQVCRVVAKGHPLTQKQEEQLRQIMDIDYIDDLYAEHISDNMKELVRAGDPEYLASHKGEYLKLWIELGLTWPGVYLDAYIEQTRGYYSPSAVYPVAEVEGVIENDTGVYSEYLIRGSAWVKIREILLKLHTIFPLYGTLWSMGSLFWMLLLSLGLTLGQYKARPPAQPSLTPAPTKGSRLCARFLAALQTILPWLPNLAVVATLLIATPVATEFRYAYNLAYCLPFYLVLMFLEQKQATAKS